MNRCISINAEGLKPSLLPPEQSDGPVRVLFLNSQTLGFATHSRSLEVYADAHPDLDAVHIRLRAPASVRSLGRAVPGTARAGLDFHRVRHSRLWAREMRRWFRTTLPLARFDLVHVMTQHQAVAMAAIPYPTRPAMVVQLDATTEQECRDFGLARAFRAPVIRSERRVLQAASLVSCWSQWAADSVIDDYGIPAGRVMVARPAPLLAPVPAKGERPARSLVRIGFVGNAWERKGGNRLLRWHQKRWRDRAELHIFGDVPDLPTGARNVVRYGPIPHAELIDLHLPLLDLVVIPTTQDTLLLSGVEAASRGVPVVTSRLAGVSETVQHGVTGFLCDPESDDEFMRAVETLLDDPARRVEMGRASVEFVRTHWNADQWHRAYMDTLVEIARRHRATTRPATRRKPGTQRAASTHAH
jgi:glycosyltransferase involved in cell wall biosynthesis